MSMALGRESGSERGNHVEKGVGEADEVGGEKVEGGSHVFGR